MTVQTNELRRKDCVSCEGGIPALASAEARQMLESVPEWELTEGGKRIRREWEVEDFASGLDFFCKVGELAEEEGHHPDLHLVGYRNLAIELSTHAVDGLTENDFILAAKIDEIPIRLND